MGVDQNYGPFWGLYYSIFLKIKGTKKGPIILISPHIPQAPQHQEPPSTLSWSPYGPESWVFRVHQAVVGGVQTYHRGKVQGVESRVLGFRLICVNVITYIPPTMHYSGPDFSKWYPQQGFRSSQLSLQNSNSSPYQILTPMYHRGLTGQTSVVGSVLWRNSGSNCVFSFKSFAMKTRAEMWSET